MLFTDYIVLVDEARSTLNLTIGTVEATTRISGVLDIVRARPSIWNVVLALSGVNQGCCNIGQ